MLWMSAVRQVPGFAESPKLYGTSMAFFPGACLWWWGHFWCIFIVNLFLLSAVFGNSNLRNLGIISSSTIGLPSSSSGSSLPQSSGLLSSSHGHPPPPPPPQASTSVQPGRAIPALMTLPNYNKTYPNSKSTVGIGYGTWALFQYPIRSLKVSKWRDFYLELSDRSEIWPAALLLMHLSNFKALR